MLFMTTPLHTTPITISVTPVGNFTGAIENRSNVVSQGDYLAWQKLGISEQQE
jgi:hypothetical protein